MSRPVLGIIGAGQLARMMLASATALDLDVRLLAARADDGAARAWPAVTVGRPTDAEAVLRFGAGCEIVTFDHELVPPPLVEKLAAQVTVRPGPAALLAAQDKLHQRRRFTELGLPVPRFAPAEGARERALRGDELGWPVVVKAPRGGYDGRGVAVATAPAALEAAWESVGRPDTVLLEEHVPLQREIAVLLARSHTGDVRLWPVVDTRQEDGILVELTAPATLTPRQQQDATAIARQIAEGLDVVGVMAVELFVTAGGLLVNEIALRPHNSGHWTIEGAVTSQFSQHLRAVAGLPLGSTAPTAPAVASVNLLGPADGRDPADSLDRGLAHPDAHVHLYGKAPRPGRKVGHVTVCADTIAEASARARAAAAALTAAP